MLGRNEKGRFVQGNKASPGRPRHEIEMSYMNILKQGVSADDFRKIVDVAVSRAKAGDDRARAWIGDYVLGKPLTTIQLQASDQALLNTLLKQFESNGVTASDVFLALLNEMTESEVETDG
jgi:hypothetical protein